MLKPPRQGRNEHEHLAKMIVKVMGSTDLTPSEMIDLITLLMRYYIPQVQRDVAAGLSLEKISFMLAELGYDVSLIQQILQAVDSPSTPIPAKAPVARSLKYEQI